MNCLGFYHFLFFQDHPVPQHWDCILKEVMFRRRLPFTQIAFATLLGVAGGFYIYRPYFEPVVRPSEQQQNQDVPKKQNEEDWNTLSLPGNSSQAEARRSTSGAAGLSDLEAVPKTAWTHSCFFGVLCLIVNVRNKVFCPPELSPVLKWCVKLISSFLKLTKRCSFKQNSCLP